jgi:hypothetical protein
MRLWLLTLRPVRSLKRGLVSIAVASLLVTGLLLASIALTPLTAPVHALHAPAMAASQAPDSIGANGTLASFVALFPELLTVHLPLIVH